MMLRGALCTCLKATSLYPYRCFMGWDHGCGMDVAMSSGLLLTRFSSGASGTKVRFERLQIGEDGGKGEWFCTSFPMFEDADLNNDTWGTSKIGLGSSDGIYIFVYCIHCFIGMSWFIGDGDASGVPVMLRNILVWLWTFFLSGDSKATPDDARWPCISTALYICWGMNF